MQAVAHRCTICGRPASFGFGPPLRRDRIWTCAAHREHGTPKAPLRAKPPERPQPDLFGATP
jgi:hypothetical protein